MAQIVGQHCVLCNLRIGYEGEARFCPMCGCPVHTNCSMTAERGANGCQSCGSPVTSDAPQQKEIEKPDRSKASSKQRQRAGCIIAAGGFLTLSTVINLARILSREPSNIGLVGNAVIGVMLGCGLLLFGVITLARSGR